jgi:hypothetical protein
MTFQRGADAKGYDRYTMLTAHLDRERDILRRLSEKNAIGRLVLNPCCGVAMLMTYGLAALKPFAEPISQTICQS